MELGPKTVSTHTYTCSCTYTCLYLMHVYVQYVHAPVSEWCDDKMAGVPQVLIAIVEESVSLWNGTIILLLHNMMSVQNSQLHVPIQT